VCPRHARPQISGWSNHVHSPSYFGRGVLAPPLEGGLYLVAAAASSDKATKIMSEQIVLDRFSGYIDGHPDHCPICHTKVIPRPVASTQRTQVFNASLEIAYICPNSKCQEMFIAYFQDPIREYDKKAYRFEIARPIRPVPELFSKFIQGTSQAFCSIYNEAHHAEQLGLTEVCGVGYRKALEFLVKDYLIKNPQNDAETIKSALLGACIQKYITDDRVKQVAKRAAWLGNDETHYTRRWKNKDLSDLKTMINLVLHWMEAEHLTQEALKSMPERGP
jgi:hypothetical protein